ncbi:MAG: sulfur transferase domain-containing protein [Pirellulales bacterium]
MDKRLKLNAEITVGCQPSKLDLQELALEGYRGVVNLRYAGEEAEQLSPATEGGVVERLGMHYEHLPIAADAVTAEVVDQFRKLVDALPKPVFAHCKSGKRAGLLALLKLAADHGWDGRQTLIEAEQMGIDLDRPALRDFASRYADAHMQKAHA